MDRVLSSFLLLLRNALWNSQKPLPGPLSQDEWQALFAMAKEQTVEGNVMDAVGQLPAEQKPPLCIRQQIEQSNALLNRELLAMLALMNERHLKVVLMKGQGAASRYPIPLHRSSGDIDLFVPDDFEAVNDLMFSMGAEQGKITPELHTDYSLHGVSWEIHNHISDMGNSAARRFIYTDYPREVSYVEIEGRPIPVFQPSFDAVYMVAHMVRHVLSEGVGLRQLCDWMMLLHRKREEIDKNQLIGFLETMHLVRPFKVLGVIVVEKLGLSPADFPLDYGEKERRVARLLWRDIFKQGNFGKYSGYVSTPGLWGKFCNYIYVLKRCVRLYGVCPAEASRRPLMKVVRFFQRGMK